MDVNRASVISTGTSPVFFLHIPKAAGTTVRSILRRNFPRNALVELDSNYLTHEQQIKSGMRRCDTNLRIVTGHCAFGIHRYINATLPYFTFVRHPFERIRSHYCYILDEPRHYHHSTLVANKLTFEEFLADTNSPELFNQQTRLIEGCSTSPRNVSEETFQRALDNLRNHFVLVGVAERFNESLVALKIVLDLHDIRYFPVNVGVRTTTVPLTEAAKRMIQATNEYDIRLFDAANRMLDDRISALGDQFTSAMAEFEESIPKWSDSVWAKTGKLLFNLRRTTSKLKRRIKRGYF